MVQVVSDNRKVKKLIEKMIGIVCDNGGKIDPDLEFHCTDKNINVRTPRNSGPRQIFSIPHDLLVPYDAFEMGIRKNRLVIRKTLSDASKIHKELMGLMVKLYNETDKLTQHRATSPWLLYRKTLPVLDLLLKARESSECKSIREMAGDEDRLEALECLTFFRTRLLNCRLNKRFRTLTPVLMPLVDLMNHSVMARGYDNIYGPKKGRLSITYRPVTGTDECFVDYGAFDALDTYLHYGFVEASVPFMRSVPLKIDCGEIGEMVIGASYAVADPKNIPQHLSDLGFYMPVIRRRKDKAIVKLSHIFIPGKGAPLSMRRIIHHAVCALNNDLKPDIRKNLMQQIEIGILNANLAFYNQLAEQPEVVEGDGIFALSKVQRDKIECYKTEINNINQ